MYDVYILCYNSLFLLIYFLEGREGEGGGTATFPVCAFWGAVSCVCVRACVRACVRVCVRAWVSV